MQGTVVANGPCDQHGAAGACIQRHRLRVVNATVQCFGEGDVGTRGQSTVVGGVKRGAGRCDHSIIGNHHRVGAAGSHQATPEGATAHRIGFKVRWGSDATDSTAIHGVTTVVHEQSRCAIQGAYKTDATTREDGRRRCAAYQHSTIVGLCEVSRVHTATIDQGGTMHREVAKCRHCTAKRDRRRCHAGVATECHGADQAEGTGAGDITVQGGHPRADNLPNIVFLTRCDTAGQTQRATATVEGRIR